MTAASSIQHMTTGIAGAGQDTVQQRLDVQTPSCRAVDDGQRCTGCNESIWPSFEHTYWQTVIVESPHVHGS